MLNDPASNLNKTNPIAHSLLLHCNQNETEHRLTPECRKVCERITFVIFMRSSGLIFERHLLSNRLLSQTVVVVLMLCGWELAVDSFNAVLIPGPVKAACSIFDLSVRGIMFQDLFESLRRVLLGFTAASIFGIALGFILGSFSRIRSMLSPVIEILRPIPPIAWIPLAMSIFGLGDGAACFVIFIGAFYPVLTNTILGVREVPEIFIDAARSLGCSRWSCFRRVICPASLPSIFAGLKVGLGFAWMCVVAAEMIAARSGLGYEIQLNRQLLRLDRVVAGMIAIGVVGFIMNWCLSKIEKKCLPWRNEFGRVISDEAGQSSEGKSLIGAAYSQGKVITGASIELRDITILHENSTAPVIENFSMEIERGEVLCILGPSGCGKTTLLRAIAGLLVPRQGKVLVDGKEITRHDDKITMVFQNGALFPWRTAEGNVCFALETDRHAHITSVQSRQMSQEYLRLVGLEGKSQCYPQQLSGGQQQRLALARALAYSPSALLLDEPFSSLDSQTREKLQEDLTELLSERGITAVFVTHDIREAVFIANRIVVLSRSGGRVLAVRDIAGRLPRDDSFRYTPEFSLARQDLWKLLSEASYGTAGNPPVTNSLTEQPCDN